MLPVHSATLALALATPFACLAQIDSTWMGRNRGSSGVMLQTQVPAPGLATPLIGPGGVPPGYEEVVLTLPTPGGAISADTATGLGAMGFQVRSTYPYGTYMMSGAGCNNDYSGYVAVGICPAGNDEYGSPLCATPGTTYAWCGAAGTATSMRKIVTDGRVPTELTPTQIQAQSTAMGALGIVDNAISMNRVCVQTGYTRMYSYGRYEYDSSGVFSNCGKRLSSHFNGTSWVIVDSCTAVARLVCY